MNLCFRSIFIDPLLPENTNTHTTFHSNEIPYMFVYLKKKIIYSYRFSFFVVSNAIEMINRTEMYAKVVLKLLGSHYFRIVADLILRCRLLLMKNTSIFQNNNKIIEKSMLSNASTIYYELRP